MTRRRPLFRSLLAALGAASVLAVGAAPAMAQRAAPSHWSAPSAAARSAAVAQFDADVGRMVAAWKAPGLAIAVVRNDTVLFAKGYGVRELGKPGAIDTETRFAIGSTTKAMTTAALAILVDEGKVRWDEPVITYLPAFRLSDPYVTRSLTVRDLVTHRSGLGNADLLWMGSDYSLDEVFRRVGTLPLAYPFRAGWVYQNIMYAVAGEVVHAASGVTWDEFVRTRLLTPLGMHRTVTRLADLAGQPNVATPHATIDDTLRVTQNRPVDVVAPAGSVWSSVDDMSRWMRFLLDSGRVGGKRLLSTSAFNELFTPQVMADRSTYPTLSLVRPRFFTYGLAWFIQDYAGQGVAMHTGSIDGMSALIGLLPEKRLGVYVLANGDHAELRHALMYEVFDRFGVTPEATRGTRDWSAAFLAHYDAQRRRARAAVAESRRDVGAGPSLPLERYVGTYRNVTFGDVHVTARGDALHARFGSSFDGDLVHAQYDVFRARWADRRSRESMLTFLSDGAGHVSAVKLLGLTFNRADAAR